MRRISSVRLILAFGIVLAICTTGHFSLAQTERPATARTSESIVYHGKVIRPDGRVLNGNVQLTVRITSPEPSQCLLWAETQTINARNGSFSIELGYTGNRIPGPEGGISQSFREVFINNPGLSFSNATCVQGTSYTPGVSDDRLLAATFQDAGVTVSVDRIPIKSVPFAKQAQEIAGFGVSNLMKISGTGSQVQFSPEEVDSLSTLLGGNLLWDLDGKRATNLADPTSPQDAATKAWVQSQITGLGTGSVSSVNVSGLPLSVTNATSTPTLSIAQANGSQAGFLSAADWTLFNSKQPSGAYLTGITGAQVTAALGFTPISSTSSSEVISALGYSPTTSALPSNQVFIGNGSNIAAAGFFGVGNLRNSSGTVQFPSSCAASQTLTWSAITDVFSCTNIGSLPASAITSGTIDNARLPFGASLWQDGLSGNIYYNGGNVGIGTASPSSALEVAGYIEANGIVTSGASTMGGLLTISDSGGYLMLGHSTPTKAVVMANSGEALALGTGNAQNAIFIQAGSAGNVGIGTVSPLSRLSVSESAIGASSGILLTDSSESNELRAAIRMSNPGRNGLLELMDNNALVKVDLRSSGDSFLNGGNVGIGTSSPSALLEVAGQVKITGGSPGAGKVLQSDAAGLASWVTPASSESTAVSNIGTAGTGVYKQMSGTTIQLKKINAASGAITIGDDIANDEIDIGLGTVPRTSVTSGSADHVLINDGSGNLSSEANLAVSRGGTGTSALTANRVLVGNGTSAIGVLSAGSAGQMLQSAGASAPAWSTATYPSSSGTSGTILRSNGTNIVNSTSVYPDTVGINQLLYASSANNVAGLATANSSVLLTNGSGVPAWSAINSDTFTQYALLAGRSGGQTINGGTAASNNLTLDSTFHATKGNILLNPTGGNVGIGTSSPGAKLEVAGQIKITGGSPGAGKVLQSDADGLATWATLGGSESTAVSNVGTAGVGVYKQMTVSTIELKKINAGSSAITITDDTGNNELDIGLGTVPRSNVAAGTANHVLINDGTGNLSSEAVLAVSRGGTGASSITANRLMVGNGTSSVSVLAAGTSGQMLQSAGASAPAWSTATYPSTTTINQILYSSSANTVAGLVTTNSAVLVTDGSGVPGWSALSNDNFTQYVRLAGRSGGQTLSGGTAASNDLTLDSTSNATKGNIILNPAGGNVGIGTTSPADKLDVVGKIRATHICADDGTNCKDLKSSWNTGGGGTSMSANYLAGATVTVQAGNNDAGAPGKLVDGVTGSAAPDFSIQDSVEKRIRFQLATAKQINLWKIYMESGADITRANALAIRGSNNATNWELLHSQGLPGNGFSAGVNYIAFPVPSASYTYYEIEISGDSNYRLTWFEVEGFEYGSGGSDDFGNHIASQNVQLGTFWLSGDGDNEGVRVNSAGNVGIGTTSPGKVLDVNGATRLQGALTFGSSDDKGTITYNVSNFYLRGLAGQALDFGSNGSAGKMVLDTAGNVGIGTTSPSARLEVAGQIKITGGSPGAGKVLQSDASGLASWVAPSSGSVTQIFGTAPLSVSNGTSTPTISMTQANGSQAGYLSSADWTLFNNKQPAGNYLTAVAGASLANGNIWVGNGSSQAAAVAMSGDVTMTNTGATTVGKISNTSVTGVGLANNNVLQNNSGSAIAANNILVSNGTATGVTALTTPASGMLIASGSVPGWSALSNDNFTQYALLAGRSGGQTLNGGTAASNNLTLDSTAHATKGNILLNPSGGRVGIGTTSPTAKIQISDNTAGAWSARIQNDNATGNGLYIRTQGTGSGETAFQVAPNAGAATGLIVRNDGNVGIGTTSPSAKLEVAGEVKFGNTSSTCNSANEGQQRYNSTSKKMEFCNGSAWGEMGGSGSLPSCPTGDYAIKTPSGWGCSSTAFRSSCKAIKDAGESTGNGTYWIKLANMMNAIQVYCDMTTDGGGWTLVSSYMGTTTPTSTSGGVGLNSGKYVSSSILEELNLISTEYLFYTSKSGTEYFKINKSYASASNCQNLTDLVPLFGYYYAWTDTGCNAGGSDYSGVGYASTAFIIYAFAGSPGAYSTSGNSGSWTNQSSSYRQQTIDWSTDYLMIWIR